MVVSAVCGCFCWISGESGRVLSYVLYSSGVMLRYFLFRRKDLILTCFSTLALMNFLSVSWGFTLTTTPSDRAFRSLAV